MSLYLVHLAEPFGHARHYLGYTDRQDGWRLSCHANGTGANMLRHVRAAGVGWTLTRVWPAGDRSLERRLKSGHSSSRYCPPCQAAATGYRIGLGDGAWLTSATFGRRRRCRCGGVPLYARPWGRGTAGLCWPCAARYSARSTGATDAELAAGTYAPRPAREAA